MGSTIRVGQSNLNGDPPHVSLDTGAKRVQPIVEQATFRGTEVPVAQPQLNVLLRKIPRNILRRVEPHFRKVSLASGEHLYRPEEGIESIYFPETAVISELQILEDGRTIEVSITGREGAVGLLSLYCPGNAANWVQICGSGTAVKINREALRKEVRNIEWVDQLFHEYIQLYVRQISQKVACNAHHSVEERFCTWLLMLHDRSPRGRLKLTQEHIARVLGVYRPSVTCIAQHLREKGLIDYVRGVIVILDRDKLREHGCACYAELNDANLNVTRLNEFAGQSSRYVF